MRDERGPWYLLTALILGVSLGLVYAWKFAPVRYVDIAPSALEPADRDQYRVLIAAAYAADHDLERAKARLSLLNDPDPARTLTMQAQRALAGGHPGPEADALGLLAVALGQGSSPGSVTPPQPVTITAPPLTITPTSATPVETSPPTATLAVTSSVQTPTLTATSQDTSAPTITPLPTRTPTPTSGAPFVIQGQAKLVCDPKIQGPLLQVETRDADGNPIPGVEVIVNWPGGEEHIFTGLKPEISVGYADYLMTPDTTYSLHTTGGGQVVSDLTPQECQSASGQRYWGSWLVVFSQP